MRKRRILVVDDSITAREVFADELEELGYAPTRAASAEEALALPGWQRFDAYVVDVRLPGMSGFDFLQRLKAETPEAVVILVSQFEAGRNGRGLRHQENVWFFRKPTDPFALASTLKNAFEAKDLRRDVERMRALVVGLKSVGQVRDLAQEFRVLLHLAVDSLGADAGAIFLKDDGDEPALRMEVGVGLPAGAPERVPAEGALGRCLDRQEAVLVTNARVAKLGELEGIFPGVGRVHLLAVPLTAQNRLIGVLELFRDSERGEFDERDAAMARLYAATSAVALENLRLSERAASSYRRQVEAQRELVQARKLSSLGQVTAGLSHEIRNPLTVIIGNIDLMRRREGADRFAVYLDRVQDQVDRILRLVQDLKAVYHPGTARFGAFRLSELVAEALALAPPPDPAAAPRVAVEVTGDVHDDQVQGDFSQVLQVLINLLTNAYHVLADGGLVKVTIETLPGERRLLVHDDGPGIPPEARARVFQPFFTTKGQEGTGLGLWISQSILRSHGGSLELVDHPAGGACFRLRFPRGDAAAAPAAVAAPGLPGDGGAAKGAGRVRVLVVDDADEVREYLQELLESEGFEVAAAAHCDAGLAELEAGEFDLLILDGNLRGASGAEFYARVVRPRFGTPTMYFTGSDETPVAELLALGMRAVLRKPARGHRILEAVRRSLLTHVDLRGAGGG